jgi:hypothetical protein
MPVWFERSLQGADTLQTADGIAIRMGRDFSAWPLAGRRRRKPADTQHMVIETTHCTRESARMR